MMAILQPNADDGKAPLRVNFDGRISYVKFNDGDMAAYGASRLCSYTFTVYRNSKLIEKVSNSDGMWSYKFDAKGKYFITVYVCRGEACEDDGVTVNVR